MASKPPAPLGFFKQLYRKWKTLRLPWRRQFLAGADLAGNTFWEFKDHLNATRLRRIVKYARQGHYADVKISREFLSTRLCGSNLWPFASSDNKEKTNKNLSANILPSPAQWHQWLRHTRHEPPSIQEQTFDVARRERMKELAAQADERWRSQESFLDAPRTQQPAPAVGTRDPAGYAPMTEPEEKQGVRSGVEDQGKVDKAVRGEEVDEGRFRGETSEKDAPVTANKGKGKKTGEAPWAKQIPKGAPGEKWQPESWTPGAAPRR